MKPLMMIFRAPDSDWLKAMQWAKDNDVPYVADNEGCYRGVRYDVTHVYAQAENILTDYGRLPSKPEILTFPKKKKKAKDELVDKAE